MSGKNQFLCLGCNAPLEVDLLDESNVVHCDNCGTLSVVQPGMTEISSAEPEDALPFSLDDLLAENDPAENDSAESGEAELSLNNDADQDDSFELDFELSEDLFSQPPAPQLSSPQLSSPQLSSPQLSSPQLSTPEPSAPQASSLQTPLPVSPQLSDNLSDSSTLDGDHSDGSPSGDLASTATAANPAAVTPTAADPATGQAADWASELIVQESPPLSPSTAADSPEVNPEQVNPATAEVSPEDATLPSIAVPAVTSLSTSVVVPDINPPGLQNVATPADNVDHHQNDQPHQTNPAGSLPEPEVIPGAEIIRPTSEAGAAVENSSSTSELPDAQIRAVTNAEPESPGLPEPALNQTQAETISDSDTSSSEAESEVPEVEGDYPASGSDSMITGDLMFFFESLEDAPEDAQPAPSAAASAGQSARPNLPETSTAAAATAQISTSGSDTESDQAATAQTAATTPRAVRNLFSELFASLKDETSIISHVHEDEEDFRTALKAYLESLPNHNLTRMAPKASINRIVDVQTGKLTLSLYQEKRTLVKRTVAYKGWAIPERKRDETNTRAWDISWKPPKEPTDSEESKIVSDSQELKGCNRCQQTGQATCKTCRGKGRFGCAACTASGLMVCNSCEGTGQRSGSRQVRGTRRCTICAGAGKQQYIPADEPDSGPKVRTCTKCAGSGRESFVESEAFQVACESCNASGRIPCQVCRGKRNVACQDCSGRGAKQCRACLGNKILVTYLEVRRTFQERTANADLIGSHAEELFDKSFQAPFTVGHHQSHYWSGPAPLQVAEMMAQATGNYGGLAETARAFLDDSLQNSLCDEKIASRTTAWKVNLQQFSTRSVIYTIGKRKYRTLWDTKESDVTSSTAALPQVFPHRSIVTNWCLSQLSELRRNAEETGVRDAALRYQRLQAIADVDPACKQAIAEQESTKDDTLQQIVTASRTVKASRAQLIMYCTAAIILIAAIPIYFWLNDLIPVIGCVVASAVVGLIGWKVVGND